MAVSKISGSSSMEWCPASGSSTTGVTRPDRSYMNAPMFSVPIDQAAARVIEWVREQSAALAV